MPPRYPSARRHVCARADGRGVADYTSFPHPLTPTPHRYHDLAHIYPSACYPHPPAAPDPRACAEPHSADGPLASHRHQPRRRRAP
jgi:hypothetical protein